MNAVSLLQIGPQEPRVIVIGNKDPVAYRLPGTGEQRIRGAFRIDDHRAILGGNIEGNSRMSAFGFEDGGSFVEIGMFDNATAIYGFQPNSKYVCGVELAHFQPRACEFLRLPKEWNHVTPDRQSGVVWIGRANVTGQAAPIVIATASTGDASSFALAELPFRVSPYLSALLDVERRQIVVVDFSGDEGRAQTVTAISTESLEVTQHSVFWHERFKRPQQAAALSAHGGRLYVLANASNQGNGVRVFDLETFEVLDHLFVEEQALTRMSISADEGALYLLKPGELLIADAMTGDIVGSRPLQLPIQELRFTG